MHVQTRNLNGEITLWESLDEAFERAAIDDSIWKISFNALTEERIRLIRTDEGWIYEDIFGNRRI